MNANSTLTLNNANDCTFPGSDSQQREGTGTGKVNLVKNGGGTLLLSGANSYTGTTTMNGGTIDVTGSISIVGLSMASGTTLYFNRTDGFFGCNAAISGDGTVQIKQGAHSFTRGRAATSR